MFMIYVVTKSGDFVRPFGFFFAVPARHVRGEGAGLARVAGASECMWMVPGTVDPLD